MTETELVVLQLQLEEVEGKETFTETEETKRWSESYDPALFNPMKDENPDKDEKLEFNPSIKTFDGPRKFFLLAHIKPTELLIFDIVSICRKFLKNDEIQL